MVKPTRLVHNCGMSAEQVPPGISTEDWATTPVAVRALVMTLLPTIELLQQRAVELQQRVTDLEERLRQNSRNSSKPPSSDPANAPPRPTRTPSGRHGGAQPGHPGHHRRRKTGAQVNRVVDVKPTTCGACGALLLGADPHPQCHQVTELPRVEPQVTEYRCHALTCLACGTATTAAWPVDLPPGNFGPRLQATIGYLSGRLGLSQRDIEETLETLFHADLSLGSVSAQEAAVSAALAQPVREAQTYVQQQPAANLDETGWHEQSKRAWLWVCATPLVAVFLLVTTRSAQGVKQLLGEAFQGIVGSDRWSAYAWLDPRQRQLCWAHLKRDFQKLVERGGESTRLGQALLEQVDELFRLWGRVREGTLRRDDFQVKVQPIRARVQALLREGMTVRHVQTRHLCENLLKLEVALWTFVFVEGVEPTNNHAERCLRRAVLWRRRSFGTQSSAGSLFVARILTAVTTLRQQKRNVLDYLTEACAAAIRGDKPPSLLPNSQTN
jgi:transposase